MTKKTQTQKVKPDKLAIFSNVEQISNLLTSQELCLISYNGFNALVPLSFLQLIQDSLEREKSLEHLVNQEYELLDKKTKRILYLKFKEEFEQ